MLWELEWGSMNAMIEKWFYKAMTFELDGIFLKAWSASDPLRCLKTPDLLNQNPQN